MRPADVVKLCADLGAMTSPDEAANHFLVATLRLVGAPLVSMMWSRPLPGVFEPGTGLLAGVNEGTARALQTYYGKGEYARDPHNRAIRSLCPGPEAVTRRQTVCDSDWYSSEHVEGRRQCGFDDVLTSSRSVPGGEVFLSLHRAWGERPFSEDERQRLTLLTRCGGWLLTQLARDGFVGPSTASLPPRLNRLLEHLLAGRPERDAASQLGLAFRTVHKYVEQIYRHFGVSSRPELMALLLPPPARRLHPAAFYPME